MLLQVNSSNFEEEVIKNEKPVLVAFFANWSHPSKMVIPILEEINLEMEGRVHFVQLDIDECHDVPNQYQVAGVPTSIFFKNGQVADRLFGPVPKSKFKSFIDNNL